MRGLILYGSRARGDFKEDSDVDLMLLLDPQEEGDLFKAIDAISDHQYENDLYFSVRPVDVKVFERGEFYIYRAAKREGIVL